MGDLFYNIYYIASTIKIAILLILWIHDLWDNGLVTFMRIQTLFNAILMYSITYSKTKRKHVRFVLSATFMIFRSISILFNGLLWRDYAGASFHPLLIIIFLSEVAISADMGLVFQNTPQLLKLADEKQEKGETKQKF